MWSQKNKEEAKGFKENRIKDIQQQGFIGGYPPNC